MSNMDLQAEVTRAAASLDRRWVDASRRITQPMPTWLGPATGLGMAGAGGLIAAMLPRPLRKLALSSTLPLLLSRVFK